MEGLTELPLSVDALPASIQKFADPAAPGPAKMMAARGMVPVKGGDLVTMLAQLGSDSDIQVATAARKSLDELPENILIPACQTDLHSAVLNYVAERHARNASVCEAVVLNVRTHGETIFELAKNASQKLCELIAINEDRILRFPTIVESLYKNKNTRMSTADRLIELVARHGIELSGIACFKEHAEALQGQLIPEPSADPLPSDTVFSEALDLDEQISEELDETPQEKRKREREAADAEKKDLASKPLTFRIAKMSSAEKMRLCIIGDASARSMLVKDNNKQVAMAAVKSPKVSDTEAAAFASSREVGEDIIRFIAGRKQFLSSYEVKKSLVFNPKTPVAISLKFLGHMHDKDLKTISKSKDVAGPLRSPAGQKLAKKEKK